MKAESIHEEAKAILGLAQLLLSNIRRKPAVALP